MNKNGPLRILRLTTKRLLLIGVALLSSQASPLFAADPLIARITTSIGVVTAQLNERAAPTTVANFVNLAQRGFYDGLTFHRWEKNFMIQGGDPLGDGKGGPGYRFSGEIILRHNQPGILSMANSGQGTDGSQFFITHLATAHLNGKHSVFGKVIDGLPVVQALRRKDMIVSIRIEGDYSALLDRKASQLAEWNSVLDTGFPGLLAAP